MNDIQQITDFSRIMSFLLTAVTAGFAVVIWWIIRGLAQDIKEIRADQINHKANCLDRFRTKEEAERQWTALTEKLTYMDAQAKERSQALWNKMEHLTERVTRLDQQITMMGKQQ